MNRTTFIALNAAILTALFVALPNSVIAYDGYVYQDTVDRDCWLYDVYDQPVYYIPDYRCGFHGGCDFRVTRDFLPGYHRVPLRDRINQKEQFLYEQQLNAVPQREQPKRLDASPQINRPEEKLNGQPQLKPQLKPQPSLQNNQPLLPPIPTLEEIKPEKNKGELSKGFSFPQLLHPKNNLGIPQSS